MPEAGKKEKEEVKFGGIRIIVDSKNSGEPGKEDLISKFFRVPGEPAGDERKKERQEEGQEGSEEGEESEFSEQVEKFLLIAKIIDEMEDGPEKREGEGMLADLIKALYSGLTQEYRPALKYLLPIIGELLGKDLNLLLLPLLKLSNEVGESEEVLNEHVRGRKSRAKAKKGIYDAYTEAGFTPDQAMTLLLNDTFRNSGGLITQMASTVASSAIDKASGPVAKVAAVQARKRAPSSSRRTVKEE